MPNHLKNAEAISGRFIVGSDRLNKRVAIATLLFELRAMLNGSYGKNW